MDSVGVRELSRYLAGEIPLYKAEDLIATRTRRLARRQMRWFDKLARTLEGRASVTVPEDGVTLAKLSQEANYRQQE
jgi:tRNA dimethylallyltransferase